VNDVRVVDPVQGAHPAARDELIPARCAISTGLQSRAELLFPERTLTRLGAETTLRFSGGARDLLLERGTVLLQVPAFHGGALIRTGSLTAAVSGATILIELLPARSLKIVVLEGDLRLSVNEFLGDSMVLTPGKMLITSPKVRRLPDPVDVDLRTLTKTSSLIDPVAFQGSSAVSAVLLPSMPLIARTIERQARLIKSRTLLPTNLVILGSGTNVVIPASGRTAVESRN
jgi:hypothetical protein